MHKIPRWPLCVLLLLGTSSGAVAGLGARYDSYRDMHRKTQYGSLFFNESAIRYLQSRQVKRFVEITENGPLNLPLQDGYCFVFNHYESPNGNELPRKYQAKIKKDFSDGRQTEEPFERDFVPTSSVYSSNLPDLCITGTNNVTQVSVKFTSDDGTNFDWQISFQIK